MIDLIQLSNTTHDNQARPNGGNTTDGDLNTYLGSSGTDSASGSGGSFAAGDTIISTHTFNGPHTIKQVKFKIYTSTSSNSSTDNAAHSNYAMEYQVQGDSTWRLFTGASGSNGSFNPGLITIDQTVLNVVAVRVRVSNSGSFHNSDGSHSWDLRIYEIQAFGEAGGYAAVI